MSYNYYVMEIQQYKDGSFGDIRHFVWDTDADKARLKGEGLYYQVLAAAAVSELPSHAAILFNFEGVPIMHQCYKHAVALEPESEPKPEPAPEPEPAPDPEPEVPEEY